MKTMKTIQFIILIALFTGFSSCSNDDDEPLVAVESQTITNLQAQQAKQQKATLIGI